MNHEQKITNHTIRCVTLFLIHPALNMLSAIVVIPTRILSFFQEYRGTLYLKERILFYMTLVIGIIGAAFYYSIFSFIGCLIIILISSMIRFLSIQFVYTRSKQYEGVYLVTEKLRVMSIRERILYVLETNYNYQETEGIKQHNTSVYQRFMVGLVGIYYGSLMFFTSIHDRVLQKNIGYNL